jgi:hypothetical protein
MPARGLIVPIDPKKFFADLVMSPESTLLTYRLLVSGSSRGGIVKYDVESFDLSPLSKTPYLRVTPALASGDMAAYSIPVTFWKGTPQWHDIPAPGSGGPLLC